MSCNTLHPINPNPEFKEVQTHLNKEILPNVSSPYQTREARRSPQSCVFCHIIDGQCVFSVKKKCSFAALLQSMCHGENCCRIACKEYSTPGVS